jgi:hypothetical protein
LKSHVPAHDPEFQLVSERVQEALERAYAQAGVAGLSLGDRRLRAAEPLGQLSLGDAGLLAGLAQQPARLPGLVRRGACARHKPQLIANDDED